MFCEENKGQALAKEHNRITAPGARILFYGGAIKNKASSRNFSIWMDRKKHANLFEGNFDISKALRLNVVSFRSSRWIAKLCK